MSGAGAADVEAATPTTLKAARSIAEASWTVFFWDMSFLRGKAHATVVVDRLDRVATTA